MKYVDIKWYRINKYGREELYFNHHLEDAIITRIESFMPSALSPETWHLPFLEKVSFSYRKIKWTYIPEGIEAEDPYINEYGKRPLRDIAAVTTMAAGFVYDCTKMGVKKTLDAGIDAAKAKFLEFLEVPWFLRKMYDITGTIEKVHDTRDFIDHGGREIAKDASSHMRNLQDKFY